jgi:Protein of unknown function (DUF3987)
VRSRTARTPIIPPPTYLSQAVLVARLKQALDAAHTISEMTLDEDAWQEWDAVYPQLTADRPGLLGAVTSRAEAQALRLAQHYALLDGVAIIRPAHLRAALALWTYCEDSARYIFGDALGDPTADTLLADLRAHPAGRTRTEIMVEVFGRHKRAEEINRALVLLLEYGLVRCESAPDEPAVGRPPERWFAT